MEKVCKLCCQTDYFETSAWGKLINPIVYTLFEDSRLNIAMNKVQYFFDSLSFKHQMPI
jgi:hypothetical protein